MLASSTATAIELSLHRMLDMAEGHSRTAAIK
jgi:hypothetical protein